MQDALKAPRLCSIVNINPIIVFIIIDVMNTIIANNSSTNTVSVVVVAAVAVVVVVVVAPTATSCAWSRCTGAVAVAAAAHMHKCRTFSPEGLESPTQEHREEVLGPQHVEHHAHGVFFLR